MLPFKLITIITIIIIGSMVGYYYIEEEGTVGGSDEEFPENGFVVLVIDYGNHHDERNTETHNITKHWINTTINYNNGTSKSENITMDTGLSEDSTVFYVLDLVAEIETGLYGGSYVSGINGVEDEGREGNWSWLYYVNNRQAPVAATSYKVSNGDLIEWIYSEWR
ncbi:MAG: DUF4430 domain-containing protein [Candidatus Hodarchaeota archaeon]